MSYTLFCDTASAWGWVALAKDERIVVQHRLPESSSHALAAATVAILQQAKIDFAALAQVAVGVGPGSYTGIRSGIAFAKGLQLGLGILAVGFSSLNAYPMPAAFDARAGGIYFQEPQEEPRQIAAEQVEEQLCAWEAIYTPHFAQLSKRMPRLPWREATAQSERVLCATLLPLAPLYLRKSHQPANL